MGRNHLFWIAAIGLLCAGPAFAPGQMGPHFSYQGQLLEAGEPVTDLVTMRFSLWDAASGAMLLALEGVAQAPYFIGFALSPDGRLLASGNSKGIIQLWGVE